VGVDLRTPFDAFHLGPATVVSSVATAAAEEFRLSVHF